MNLKSDKLKSSTPQIRQQIEATLMDLSNVRIREHFGLVSNDTHTGQFCFLISPPKGRGSVEKYDYVLLDHPLFGEACQVLAVITDITSYEDVAGGSSIGDKIGKMLATAEIAGYIDLRNETRPLLKVLVPPTPGCRVYVPLKKFLEDILNRNAKGEVFKSPIQIGVFEASSAEEPGNYLGIKCFIDAQDFISKHTIISAMAGAGKTHTAKLIIQEMTGKTSAQIIIFDPYNEYSSILDATVKTIEFNSRMDKETLSKEIRKGQVTILNAHGSTLEEKRSFYINTLQQLSKLRLEEKTKPLFVIIEEAENLKGEMLDQVVAEGRKIGIFLCFLTTHPTDLGGRILSQMGNQIIGKTTDKEDIEYLANMVSSTNISFSGLAFGEMIINGINSNRPMKVHVKQFA
jgi:DNA helicase HerA-like ATPase